MLIISESCSKAPENTETPFSGDKNIYVATRQRSVP